MIQNNINSTQNKQPFIGKGIEHSLVEGAFLFYNMNKIIGIYKITSPSKKVYIGQSRNIKNRWWKYKNLKCEAQPYLYNSLKKYGASKHKFEILCQCEVEELNKLEIYYIELYQCFNSEHGLNLKNGGDGGGVCCETTKINLSKSHIGQKAWNKGVKMANEHYEKCKNTMFKKGIDLRSGTKATKETREKQRNAKLNKHLSEEHKRKIAEGVKKFRSGKNSLPEPTKEKVLLLIDEISKFTTVSNKANLKRMLQ